MISDKLTETLYQFSVAYIKHPSASKTEIREVLGMTVNVFDNRILRLINFGYVLKKTYFRGVTYGITFEGIVLLKEKGYPPL